MLFHELLAIVVLVDIEPPVITGLETVAPLTVPPEIDGLDTDGLENVPPVIAGVPITGEFKTDNVNTVPSDVPPVIAGELITGDDIDGLE